MIYFFLRKSRFVQPFCISDLELTRLQQAYPDDFANRDEDKFNYRYRGGESYRDVVVRLEPVIMELERQENILIIGHQVGLDCVFVAGRLLMRISDSLGDSPLSVSLLYPGRKARSC